MRDAGFPFILEHAATRDEFVRALEEFHPDVILADYSLPDFDGLSAIPLAQENGSRFADHRGDRNPGG